MSVFDITIIIAVILAGLNGMRVGLVVEIVDLVTLLACFVAAFLLSHFITAFFHKLPVIELTSQQGFLVTFLLFMFAVYLIKKLFAGQLIASKTNPMSRLGGTFVGLVRGTLFISIVLWLLVTLSINAERRIASSKVASFVKNVTIEMYEGAAYATGRNKNNIFNR